MLKMMVSTSAATERGKAIAILNVLLTRGVRPTVTVTITWMTVFLGSRMTATFNAHKIWFVEEEDSASMISMTVDLNRRFLLNFFLV